LHPGFFKNFITMSSVQAYEHPSTTAITVGFDRMFRVLITEEMKFLKIRGATAVAYFLLNP